MAELVYREQLPKPALLPFVECFWSLEAEAAFTNVVLPDGCFDLVYSRDGGLQAAGPMTRPRSVSMPAKSCTVGVRIRPGMTKALLGITPVELRDEIVAAPLVLPKSANETEIHLAEAKNRREMVRLLCDLLPGTPPPLDGFARCLSVLASGKGLPSIDKLACQTNLSLRQFRRRCLAESGYSPKHLSRLLRFREARALSLQQAKPKWAEIAVAAGYFDQAHLIRDFSEFAGAAPSVAVLSNT